MSSVKKIRLEGIAEGGASGRYPKMALSVQTLPKVGTLRPLPGTNLARDDSIIFVLNVPVGQFVRYDLRSFGRQSFFRSTCFSLSPC
jgi:hypothetical protein